MSFPKNGPQPVPHAAAKKPELTASGPLIRRMVETYVRPRLGSVFWAAVMMLISAAMTGAMAKLLEPIIDKVFADKTPGMLWPVAGAVFLVFALRGAATYGQTVMMNNLSQRIVSDMQRDMFTHLVYADLSYFHANSSGHLMSRFISDMALVRNGVTESLTGLGKNFFTIAFLICEILAQDWKLAIISIFVFPAAAYTVMRLGKKLRKVSSVTQVTTGEMTAMLGQAFQGARHVKSYGMEDFEISRVHGVIENIYKLMNRTFRVSAILAPIGELLSGLAIVTTSRATGTARR